VICLLKKKKKSRQPWNRNSNLMKSNTVHALSTVGGCTESDSEANTFAEAIFVIPFWRSQWSNTPRNRAPTKRVDHHPMGLTTVPLPHTTQLRSRFGPVPSDVGSGQWSLVSVWYVCLGLGNYSVCTHLTGCESGRLRRARSTCTGERILASTAGNQIQPMAQEHHCAYTAQGKKPKAHSHPVQGGRDKASQW